MIKGYIIEFKGYRKLGDPKYVRRTMVSYEPHLSRNFDNCVFLNKRVAKQCARSCIENRGRLTKFQPIAFKVVAVYSPLDHKSAGPMWWSKKAPTPNEFINAFQLH